MVRFRYALLTLLMTLVSTTAGSQYRVKESVFPPDGWERVGLAPPNHPLRLRIGLPQPRFATLQQHLFEVSDPDHIRYGAHLSKEEVEALVAPHPTSLDIVDRWLVSHRLYEGNLTRSPAKDWVILTTSVGVAEKLLNTTYFKWKHSDGGHIVRATSYSLPTEVFDHVDVVQPTTMFARWKPMASTLYKPGKDGKSDRLITKYRQAYKAASVPPSPGIVDPLCSDPNNPLIIPLCLKQLYRTKDYIPRAAAKNGIGITGYLGQNLNNADLRLFYETYIPEAVNSTYTFHSVNDGLNDQNLDHSGAEAALDSQYAFGLSYPTARTFWSTAGLAPTIPDVLFVDNEPFQEWVDYVLKQNKIPLSISTSYAEHEQTVPPSYARRVCQGFAQLGARGVSLFVASGDLGVGDFIPDPAQQQCFSNDGKNTTKFLPMFPASCPYITAVGGTWLVPETAVPISGGGFSEYFSRPSYQDASVKSYLSKLPSGLYKGLYNSAGRGFPDISAQSYPFDFRVQGQPIQTGGTSASSPVVAAIVALLNDARIAKGLPPLGFLNPLLYSKGFKGLNDITIGNNPGCGTEGFNATTGWDPVTGLGTPDFLALKSILA